MIRWKSNINDTVQTPKVDHTWQKWPQMELTMKLSGSSVNDAKTVASCVPSRNFTAMYPNNVPASIFVSSIVKRTVKTATEKNRESR